MLGRRMLERRVYVRTSWETEKGSCVQTRASIGTVSIQYDRKPRVMEAEGTPENSVVLTDALLPAVAILRVCPLWEAACGISG